MPVPSASFRFVPHARHLSQRSETRRRSGRRVRHWHGFAALSRTSRLVLAEQGADAVTGVWSGGAENVRLENNSFCPLVHPCLVGRLTRTDANAVIAPCKVPPCPRCPVSSGFRLRGLSKTSFSWNIITPWRARFQLVSSWGPSRIPGSDS